MTGKGAICYQVVREGLTKCMASELRINPDSMIAMKRSSMFQGEEADVEKVLRQNAAGCGQI